MTCRSQARVLMKKRSKLKRLLINGCIAFFVAIILLETVELYLHLTYKAGEPEPFAFSPVLGWENVPGLNITFYSPYYGRDIREVHNSLGIRDVREFGNKTKPRILIIGDSFVYGWGLDQQDIIGRRLQEKLPGYEVISAGTTGYSTTQYMQEYDNRTRVLHPDIVVFAVSIDDFAQNFYDSMFGFTKPWDYAVTLNGTVARRDFSPKPIVRRPLPAPTFILPSLIIPPVNAKKTPELYASSSLRISHALYMLEQPLVIVPGEENIPGVIITSNILEWYVLNETNAKLLHDNATFVVAYIPARIQADPYYRADVFSNYTDVPVSTLNCTAPDEYLRIMTLNLNIAYLDLLPALSIEPENDYLPDSHLSPSGTARFDEELYGLLVKEKLIH